jgi:sensor c-di-GMP phosphodiesterase-like protein
MAAAGPTIRMPATLKAFRSIFPPPRRLPLLGGIVGGVLSYRLLTRRDSAGRELTRALRQNEFEPFYQPVIEIQTGRCAGVEVLIRWRHPDKGLIRPDLFIPIAEETGPILPITRQLLRNVTAQLEPLTLPANSKVGINLAPAHLLEPSLIDDCRTFLSALAPHGVALVLELTERHMVDEDEAVQQAIDDFGTGHSSLAYLHKLRVDYLKIDQAFVSAVGRDSLGVTVLERSSTWGAGSIWRWSPRGWKPRRSAATCCNVASVSCRAI